MSLLSMPLPREATPETPVADAGSPAAEQAGGGFNDLVARLRLKRRPGSISGAVVKLWRFGREAGATARATRPSTGEDSITERERTPWTGSELYPAAAPQG